MHEWVGHKSSDLTLIPLLPGNYRIKAHFYLRDYCLTDEQYTVALFIWSILTRHFFPNLGLSISTTFNLYKLVSVAQRGGCVRTNGIVMQQQQHCSKGSLWREQQWECQCCTGTTDTKDMTCHCEMPNRPKHKKKGQIRGAKSNLLKILLEEYFSPQMGCRRSLVTCL
jgi:hypothetical protein